MRLPLSIAIACGLALAAYPPFGLAGKTPIAPSIAKPVDQQRIKLSTLHEMDPGRLQRLWDAHQVRQAAAVAGVVRELREGMVGKQSGLTDHGIPGTRGNGRAGDRLGAPSRGQPPASTDPLGRRSAGITDRLRNKRPDSTVVGAGSVPRDSTGLASHSQPQDSYGDGVHTATTTHRSDRTGATYLIYSVSYDKATSKLIGWSVTTVDEFGDSRTQLNHVEYTGPNGDVPVVTSTATSSRGGAHTGGAVASGTTTRRPYREGDPAVVDPGPIAGGEGQPIAEEGTPVKLPVLPWGIECNPITGSCSEGFKLGNNQVNPGREPSASAASRPLLRVDPKSIVVNPNPVDPQVEGELRAIDRDGRTPGARPPQIPDDRGD